MLGFKYSGGESAAPALGGAEEKEGLTCYTKRVDGQRQRSENTLPLVVDSETYITLTLCLPTVLSRERKSEHYMLLAFSCSVQ